jgi:hypothetical protein
MRKLLSPFFILTSILLSAQVGINTDKPNTNAGLHVSERIDPASAGPPDKVNGVIIQRYTTVERNSLTLTANDNGLTIFNKDEKCYNYWDGTLLKWKSLCGQLGPAILDVSAFNCDNNIAMNGRYVTGTGLTTAEYVKVTVNVTEIGTYDFKAYSTPANGYYFSAMGEFLTTGVQTIIMYGTGVPVNPQTDTFKLTLNGTEVCPNKVKITVAAPLKPLSGVKLGDIGSQPEGGFAFATTWFKAFMNSWSNFGPIPASKVYTDGSPLAPENLSNTLSDINIMNQYDIIALSWRGGADISVAQRSALKIFAETPGKTLILHPEGSGANQTGLLNDLIGDITILSGDYTAAGNVGVTVATGADWIVSDPANAPFLKGIFGNVTGTVFTDHGATGVSISRAKLNQSSNIQYIAYRGNDVSVFKIKNKNVFWIEDGAPFYGGFGNTNGPACFTPQSGMMGVNPIPCSSTAANGNSSGVSIFAANMIYWALQQVQ